MPRNVRNFWVEIEVDGKKHTVKTGPAGRLGGISVRFYQRHKGEVTDAGSVVGYADLDLNRPGTTPRLTLAVFDKEGTLVHTNLTER